MSLLLIKKGTSTGTKGSVLLVAVARGGTGGCGGAIYRPISSLQGALSWHGTFPALLFELASQRWEHLLGGLGGWSFQSGPPAKYRSTSFSAQVHLCPGSSGRRNRAAESAERKSANERAANERKAVVAEVVTRWAAVYRR